MIHGINNNFLYAVSRVETGFVNPSTSEVQGRQGTGFFVVKDGQIYFITNRHVMDLSVEDAKYTDFRLDTLKFDIRRYDNVSKKVVSNMVEAVSYFETLPDDDHDDVICLGQIRLAGNNAIAQTYFLFDMLADSNCLEQEISVCDGLAVIGFPQVYDHLNNMPVLRSGVISSDPRQNYSYDNNYMGHVIAYEAFSTGGLSGSPVLAVQKGFPVSGALNAPADFYRPVKIVGINTGSMNNLEGVHQQMSFMYKSDVIRELILKCEKGQGFTIVHNKIVHPI